MHYKYKYANSVSCQFPSVSFNFLQMAIAQEQSPNLHNASRSFCQVTSAPCSIHVLRTLRHIEPAGCCDRARFVTDCPTPRAYAMKSHLPPICSAKNTRMPIETSGRFAGTAHVVNECKHHMYYSGTLNCLHYVASCKHALFWHFMGTYIM